MYLSLIRDTATGSYCLGTLQAGASLFQTLELPWLVDPLGQGGQKDRSCVPPGLYQLHRHDSPKHPKSFALVNPKLDVYHNEEDVPAERRAFARTVVLLHIANYPRDLEGCIGLGLGRGAGCIQDSGDAVRKFNQVVPWIPGHAVGIEWGSGVEISEKTGESKA